MLYLHVLVCLFSTDTFLHATPIPVHMYLLKGTASRNSSPSVLLPACAQILSHAAAAKAYCRPQPSERVRGHSFALLVVQWCVMLTALCLNGCDLISDSPTQS